MKGSIGTSMRLKYTGRKPAKTRRSAWDEVNKRWIWGKSEKRRRKHRKRNQRKINEQKSPLK
jgi:hypothetical protein